MKTYLLAIWKWLSRNFGLKLLALISAFLIWVAVVNSLDPIDTRTFYNIPVKILNEDALIRKDKIPEVVSGSTVNITVQARKSICDALTEDDIKATADFEKIYVTDTVPIDIVIEGYSDTDIDIIRGQNQYMKLSLEDYATKEFKVRINPVGTPAEGYVVGSSASSPNVISVRGSKLQISRIQAVVATVHVDGISKDMEVVVQPVVYDMNDEAMSTENLELSYEAVTVTTTLYRTRTLRLEAKTIGEVADGYEIKSVSFQPSQITVSGTNEDLAKLGTVLRAYVDVNGVTKQVEKNIDINSLIDSKLTSICILDEDDTLAVTAYVEEQEKIELILTTADVEIENVSEGFTAEVQNVAPRRLTLRCTKEAIQNANLENLRPHVDCSGLTEAGVYELPILLDRRSGIVSLSEATVRVELTAVAPTEETAVTEEQ